MESKKDATPSFRRYRKPSSSSPGSQDIPVLNPFRMYRKSSSISPVHNFARLGEGFRRYRRLSSNSPSKCLTNLFSPLLRHRKSSRNAERTTKRSTFRLPLKVPEVFESTCNYIYAFRHSLSDDGETRPFAKVIRLGDLFWRHIPVLWYNSPIHQSIGRKGKRCFLTCLVLCLDRF